MVYMPSRSGRFSAKLSKKEFLKQMAENGWLTDDERKFVSSAYDILAKDPKRGYMLDSFLDVELLSTEEHYRHDKKEGFLTDFLDEDLFTGPFMSLVQNYKKSIKPVSKEEVLKQHQKVMGYPFEERIHRLAEAERKKGKPKMNSYLSKQQFLNGAAIMGWVYVEDQEFIGTLYDTFADDPENLNILTNFTKLDAWTGFARDLTIGSLEKNLASEKVTDEQRKKINDALNKDDWKNAEVDDDALSDICEEHHGIRYEELDGQIDPFKDVYNVIHRDADKYKSRIEADEAQQKRRAELEKKEKDTFSKDFTKEAFKSEYRCKGWFSEADDVYFGALYDELGDLPQAKPLLTDIINIPVWDSETQKTLKKKIAARARDIAKEKYGKENEKADKSKAETEVETGGYLEAFNGTAKDWIAVEPVQEELDQAYEYLYKTYRNEQIKEFDETYTFSKEEFLKKAFDNGWEKKSDQLYLGTLYDYAKESHSLEIGGLLGRIMDNDVSTFDGRREMCDDINETIKEHVPEVVPGGFFSTSYCKNASSLQGIADSDLLAVNDHNYFDSILPKEREKRRNEAQLKELRGKMFDKGWIGENDKNFVKLLYSARQIIEGKERYSDNEELKNALDEAENSVVSGHYIDYNKGEIFNKLMDTFEKNGLTDDALFSVPMSFGREFRDKHEKSYNKSRNNYIEDKAREERLQKEKEEAERKRAEEERKRAEEERKREEQIKKLEEERARKRQDMVELKRYTVEDFDDDFVIEGNEVIEYISRENTDMDNDDDFFYEEDLTPTPGETPDASTGAEEKTETKNEKKTSLTETEVSNKNTASSKEEDEEYYHQIDANIAQLKVLNDIQKKLDTTHRFGIKHEDSQAIIDLRSSLSDLINARETHITKTAAEQPDILKASERVYLASRAYMTMLRKKAKVKDTDLKWKPTTKMGRERYEGAQALEDITGRELGLQAMGELFPDAPGTTEPENARRTESLADIENIDPRIYADKHANRYLKKTIDNIRLEYETSKEFLETQKTDNKETNINSPEHKRQVINRLVSRAVAAHSAADWERNYIKNGGKPLSYEAFHDFTEKIAKTIPNHKAFKAYANDPNLKATDLLERVLKDNGKGIYAGMTSTEKTLKAQAPKSKKANTTDNLNKAPKENETIKKSKTFNFR